jgi:hypothetical protein
MDKKVKNILDNLDSVGFKELSHALHFAEFAQKIKSTYRLTNEQLSEHLSIHEDFIPSILSGSYEYDVRMWSKLEVLSEKLSEEHTLMKVAGLKKDNNE